MSQGSELTRQIKRIADGDRDAFASFYDETSSFVFGLLLKILDDRDKAEDVAQEVYTQIWRTAPTYNPARSSPWTWVAMIARSRALDRTRSEGSYSDAMDELEGRPGTDLLTTGFRNPEEAATLSERREMVQDALGDLPDPQLHALTLAFFQGLSHREIADRTETPLGTVKSRIRSGLQKLERKLTPLVDPGEGGAP